VLSVIVVSLLMSLLIGPTLGMAICGIVGAAVVFPFRVRNFDQRFGACLVAVLAVGLAVSIPLYRPYPRLLLPWLPGVWWCLSWWCGRILDATESGGGGRLVARPPMWAAALIVVALLAGCVWRHPNHPWRTRLALRDVAHQINQIARQSPNRSLRVFGEPAMFFHLCETGSPHQTTPIQTLTFAKQPHRPFAPDIFLVAGPHARRSPQFQESWPDVAARLELIGEFDYFATDFVALNHHPRGEVRAGRGPNEPIRLYRLR
jgi:hypothetical protein